jgi:hypothetical protein
MYPGQLNSDRIASNEKASNYFLQVDAVELKVGSHKDCLLKLEQSLCLMAYEQLRLAKGQKFKELDSFSLNILQHISSQNPNVSPDPLALTSSMWHQIFEKLISMHDDWIIHIDHLNHILTKDFHSQIISWLASLAQNPSIKYLLLSMGCHETHFEPYQNDVNNLYLPEIGLNRWKKKIYKLRTDLAHNKEIETIIDELFVALDAHPKYLLESTELLFSTLYLSVDILLVSEIIDELVQRRSNLFRYIIQSLSYAQRNYLIACALGEQKLYSKAVLKRYELGTSANVARIKNLLLTKEIIQEIDQQIRFTDPLMKYYFQKHFIASN